jgi:hypothetical protein
MIQTGFESRVKVQQVIENQLPNFILDESPNTAEFLKQYYIDNKDKILEKGKEYYIENQKIIIDRVKIWGNNNKNKVEQYKKNYVEKNRDFINTKMVQRKKDDTIL